MTQAPSPSPTPASAPASSSAPDIQLDPVFAPHPPERRVQIERMRLLNVVLVLSLITLGLSWETWLAPLKGGSGGLLAIKVLPLAFAVPGMLKHKLYTFRWMSLLIWLYFTEGVMRATVETGLSQMLAGIEVALSVALFAGCAVYVRLRLRVLPPKDKNAPKADHA